MYIANQEKLERFIERALNSSVLAIDTEFLREKTYYARLCLIQMATDDEVVVIDPFEIEDLHVLAPLLESPSIVKVFHAGTQDIEILWREIGVFPWPLFDTQVAAALLGQTKQVGYAALVQHECDVTLKKTDSFTDWSRRPLSDSQLSYASNDVIYLPQMYSQMIKQLEKKGRLHWLDQDFADLIDPKRYERDPRERYAHLKRGNQLNARQLSAAREVAEWRELEAQKRNVPRKRILTDEQIVEACRRGATSIDELFMVRGVQHAISTPDARKVVECLKRGFNADKSTWPKSKRSKKGEVNVEVEVDLMSALARLRSKEQGVAFQTLCSRDDLVKIARGHYENVETLKGWRRQLIGDELLSLMEGKIEMHIEYGRMVVSEKEDPSSSNGCTTA